MRLISVLRFGLKVILTAAAILIVSSGSSLSNPFNPPAFNYAGLPIAGDSIVFLNDSTFTIEGVKEELSGDGEWIKVTQAEVDPDGVTDGGGFDDEINTQYVWRPYNMEPGWSPYTNGYWRYSNCGWMWNSYYAWGWRPYHYGRWWWSDYYGWVWSPGFIFAPAWVVWMYDGGYYGWYPISPRVRWHHGHGYRCHNMRYRVRNWTFCDKERFADPIITPGVIVDPMHNPSIIKGATYNGTVTIVNDQVRNQGPPVGEVEIVTGVKQPKDDVSRYNNPDKVSEILGTGGNGQKNTEGRITSEENVNRNTENNVKKDQGRNNDNERTGDNGRKDTYTPPNDNGKKDNGKKDNGKKDNSGNEKKTKQEKKKESYTPPEDKNDNEKDDNDKKDDSYTPPPDKNDNVSKNDNIQNKENDSKNDDSQKLNGDNESNDNKGDGKK